MKRILRIVGIIAANIVFWGGIFALSYHFTHTDGSKYDMSYNKTPHHSVSKRKIMIGYKTYQITTTIDTVYMPVDSANYEPLESN